MSPRPRKLRTSEIKHLELEGTLLRVRRFRSRFLGTARDILIYLPPGYDDAGQYPVLYLQDGQNLFDPETAFAHVPWQAGESIDRLVRERRICPLIVVGITNTGPMRVHEYTPTMDRQHLAGGGASMYGYMLTEELLPRVNVTFAADPSPSSTGIGGSSLGALVALYVGLEWSEYFGRILAMSPSVWWDRRSILRRIRSLPETPGSRIWIDTGTQEGTGQLPDVRRLDRVIRAKGWPDESLHLHVEEGAGHDEAAWGARFPKALEFLYPPS